VSEDLVQVWSTGSVPEGEVARARLEAEGIPVLLKGESDGPYRIGPVYLWVPASLEVQARLILDTPVEPLSPEELEELDELAEGTPNDELVAEEHGEEP